MSRYIDQYISTCDLYLYTKPIKYSLVDKLYPLLVSRTCWDMFSVGFVIELPESASCNAVITVVDSVSKKTYFILTYTIVTVKGVVWLFLHHVWKLHGYLSVSSQIVDLSL